MRQFIFFILLFIILTNNKSYTSENKNIDTLVIETIHKKGNNTYPFGVGLVQNNSIVKTIKGIPDSLEKIMVTAYPMDYLQHIYQSFHMGRISKKKYKKLMSWQPDLGQLTKEFLNVYVPIVAGFDKNGNKVVIVDQNNNMDVSDDKSFLLPPPYKIKHIFDKYNDSLLVPVKFEYFDGNVIAKKSSWLFIDHSFQNRQTDPVQLSFSVAEHRTGHFSINGDEYNIALVNDCNSGVYTKGNASIFILPDIIAKDKISKFGRIKSKYMIKTNQTVILNSDTYRFSNVSKDGKYITLVKNNDIVEQSSTQIGVQSIDFSAETFKGKKINLSDYQGKYVFLEFYMIHCPHCHTSLSSLNKLYKKYKSKDFEFIGILDEENITIKEAQKFVKTNKIKWPQILNGYNSNPNLSKLYKSNSSFPTTIIIDPNGTIVDIQGGKLNYEEAESLLLKYLK